GHRRAGRRPLGRLTVDGRAASQCERSRSHGSFCRLSYTRHTVSASFATMPRDEEAHMTDNITPEQCRESEGVEDWRVLGDGANAYFQTSSFAAGARLVQAISALPGVDELQPEVDLRNDGVTVRMLTIAEDYAGMRQPHVELARQISAAARKLGLPADPSKVQSLLVIPGATDRAKVMPFWRAALGYEPRRDSPAEDLVDPRS